MATQQEQTFAICFGNRFFFPEHLIAIAREEMAEAVAQLGFKSLIMPPDAIPNGAVGTTEDGVKFAKFLAENRGRYQGVILCLPNFSDENGAIAALQDCGTPILIQAYPDEPDKMGFNSRRDAFCGKFSIMDVFCQCGLPFTTFPPHTAHPASDRFRQHIEWFAGVCRVVGQMRRCTVGAIGARTTAFKTVRFDELTLQQYGITTEVLDLSDIIQRVQSLNGSDQQVKEKIERLSNYTCWSGVPDEALQTLARLGVVLDRVMEEYKMDALALRCWIELQKQLKIAPCVLLSEMNDRGIPAACELDVIGHQGYRHHVAVTAGHVATPIREAFGRYLGYELMEL